MSVTRSSSTHTSPPFTRHTQTGISHIINYQHNNIELYPLYPGQHHWHCISSSIETPAYYPHPWRQSEKFSTTMPALKPTSKAKLHELVESGNTEAQALVAKKNVPVVGALKLLTSMGIEGAEQELNEVQAKIKADAATRRVEQAAKIAAGDADAIAKRDQRRKKNRESVLRRAQENGGLTGARGKKRRALAAAMKSYGAEESLMDTGSDGIDENSITEQPLSPESLPTPAAPTSSDSGLRECCAAAVQEMQDEMDEVRDERDRMQAALEAMAAEVEHERQLMEEEMGKVRASEMKLYTDNEQLKSKIAQREMELLRARSGTRY
jgi:hypothetical protein